jgi:hypothetical protein
MTDKKKKVLDLEIAAIISCTAVAGFFVIYWTLQIEDVLALLRMAYGE